MAPLRTALHGTHVSFVSLLRCVDVAVFYSSAKILKSLETSRPLRRCFSFFGKVIRRRDATRRTDRRVVCAACSLPLYHFIRRPPRSHLNLSRLTDFVFYSFLTRQSSACENMEATAPGYHHQPNDGQPMRPPYPSHKNGLMRPTLEEIGYRESPPPPPPPPTSTHPLYQTNNSQRSPDNRFVRRIDRVLDSPPPLALVFVEIHWPT